MNLAYGTNLELVYLYGEVRGQHQLHSSTLHTGGAQSGQQVESKMTVSNLYLVNTTE